MHRTPHASGAFYFGHPSQRNPVQGKQIAGGAQVATVFRCRRNGGQPRPGSAQIIILRFWSAVGTRCAHAPGVHIKYTRWAPALTHQRVRLPLLGTNRRVSVKSLGPDETKKPPAGGFFVCGYGEFFQASGCRGCIRVPRQHSGRSIEAGIVHRDSRT